jgi:hypothetical protein
MALNNLNTIQKLEWKKRLKAYCLGLIQLRIDNAKQAMQSAQDSANREDKGSAGDKHETARAMSQLEKEMFANQLNEANREMELLQRIKTDTIQNEISIGSVAVTEKGIYYIATGIGQINFEGEPVFVISPKAPITIAMIGKKSGEAFSFNKLLQHVSVTF